MLGEAGHDIPCIEALGRDTVDANQIQAHVATVFFDTFFLKWEYGEVMLFEGFLKGTTLLFGGGTPIATSKLL